MPGGKVDQGENYRDAITREIKEEANMEVLSCELIGYQDNYGSEQGASRHIYSVCMVKPAGEFVTDPDEGVSEIKLIDPKDYKEYFDWGVIGDRVMARALEIKDSKR